MLIEHKLTFLQALNSTLPSFSPSTTPIAHRPFSFLDTSKLIFIVSTGGLPNYFLFNALWTFESSLINDLLANLFPLSLNDIVYLLLEIGALFD
uniref:Uncharacterized protein n=1 Tax=Nelumbo nucifera TaxID=4432 RepID=A0A822ZZ12_NELNU|nr:TPA_asm: hypothetical protein HUJ06_018542 [Nelumbo nucifera]